jgi:hypothetical protein
MIDKDMWSEERVAPRKFSKIRRFVVRITGMHPIKEQLQNGWLDSSILAAY